MDFHVFDLEHGYLSLGDIALGVSILRRSGTVPFVRMDGVNTKQMQQLADAGVNGFIFPMVESEGQGVQMREKLFHGSCARGYCLGPWNNYGDTTDTDVVGGDDFILVGMIETLPGLSKVDAIASDGWDALMIGPYDLSVALGIPKKFNAEEFVAAEQSVRTACKKHNIFFGGHIVHPNKEEIFQRVECGDRFLPLGLDALILRSISSQYL
jgi:2-keto-3-deoxy-L-rhamnonate aldolase RhmA